MSGGAVGGALYYRRGLGVELEKSSAALSDGEQEAAVG